MIRFFAQFFFAISLSVLIGLTVHRKDREVDPAYHAGVAFYPDHIPGAYTGGFGEETCHSCHFDFELNDERGRLTVDGLWETYTPGKRYELTVSVESERLENGGFQMAARFEDGSQAGRFEWTGDRLAFTPAAGEQIQYIQHSAAGTAPTSERKVSWEFVWEAPQNHSGSGPVFFHIAANAGNDDLSAFGDWIYVQEIIVSRDQ